MKSSPSIWRLLSKCQIAGEDFVIFVAFLENMNFKWNMLYVLKMITFYSFFHLKRGMYNGA